MATTTMRRWALAGAVLGMMAGMAGPAEAVFVVAPNSLASVEGNSGNFFPFGLSQGTTQRYQQVFDASQFSALGGPQFITQIAFRPDRLSGMPFPSTIDRIQINLSTTAAAPDQLSTAFANNIGADDSVVYNGPLTISSSFAGPAPGPLDFDIVIDLQAPFLYDPGAGNLLLDVRNFTGSITVPIGGPVPFFDAQFAAGDGISRVFTLLNSPGGVNSAVGTADTTGLVARFTAVPEPSSLALCGVASLAGLGARARRRRVAIA